MVEERRFNELEMRVNVLDKEIVRMDVQAGERYKTTCEKLDSIDGKLDKHIDLHIRREDTLLAEAGRREEEIRKKIRKQTEQEKSLREKLFYPAMLLLISAIIGFILK